MLEDSKMGSSTEKVLNILEMEIITKENILMVFQKATGSIFGRMEVFTKEILNKD
jgi:hypothetical protein